MAHYFSLKINDELDLLFPELSMVEELYQVVDNNRAHLRPFLDFVDHSTETANQTDYIKMKLQGTANGTDRLFLIAEAGKIIGCVDLHKIDATNRKAEIGYWLSNTHTKRGIVKAAVKKLCQYSFDTLGLHN